VIALNINIKEFQAATRRWALVSGKTQQAVLRTSAKMVISNPRQGSGLLQITPPGSQGVTGAAAKKQGEAAIARDLRKIFVPVRMKGIGVSFSTDAPGPIHRRHFAEKTPNRRIRRDRKQPYYVDVAKLRPVERELYRRVGYLASGWVESARQLGASVPSWIARHGTGRGTIRMSFTAPRYGIEMTLFAPANSPWQELQRRIPYALRYGTNNLLRQIEHQIKKDARVVGLTVR